MRKLIYLINVSLDGFVEDRGGKFDWSEPDEEVHRFFSQQTREAGELLYGRRMYETMAYWLTAEEDASLPDYMLDFARAWKSKPKVVFSTTLERVGDNCRLVRGDAAAEVTRMKEADGADLFVAGPGLASAFARLGLIDEYRVVVHPALVGGGKSYLPTVEQTIPLRLEETRVFASGLVYMRYALRRTA